MRHALRSVVDRVTVPDFGRKIAEGDPETIMKSPDVSSVRLGPVILCGMIPVWTRHPRAAWGRPVAAVKGRAGADGHPRQSARGIVAWDRHWADEIPDLSCGRWPHGRCRLGDLPAETPDIAQRAFSLHGWTVAIILVVVIGGAGRFEGALIGTAVCFPPRTLGPCRAPAVAHVARRQAPTTGTGPRKRHRRTYRGAIAGHRIANRQSCGD